MTPDDPDPQHQDGRAADATPPADAGVWIEVDRGPVVWRFDQDFLASNWTCIFGRGCRGILPEPAEELEQGCCSLGAHFGDGQPGRAEAMRVSAYAALLDDDQWQYAAIGRNLAAGGIFGDDDRTHTRLVDGACIFANRPGFPGGTGCALHLGALAAGDSPVEWKPSVCWQLPLRVEWREVDADTETATVRRWSRADWGEHGKTMAWCCTEPDDGGEAYCGRERVVDSLRDELVAIAGEEVWVEVRRQLPSPDARPAGAP